MEFMDDTIENRPYPCSMCGSINMGRETETLNNNPNERVVECVWSCSKCGRVYKRGTLSVNKENEKV